MRSISPKTRMFILAGLLVGLVLLTGLSFPREVGALQDSSQTPTITPTFLPGELAIKSGETGNLILGAAIILLVIIAGVVIQRIMLEKDD